MSNETTEDDTDELEHGIDVELSERELLCIGKIIALWATIEYEIFCQTLKSFDVSDISELPKEMNNMQFSKVLTLWQTRVASNGEGKRKDVLQQQYKRILHFSNFRNALVHGMWDWSKAVPAKITAIRIRKKEMQRTHFTAEDLESFVSELQRINFKVRYPGGGDDYANALAKQGSYRARLSGAGPLLASR
jgi:hypothetical protein